VTVHDTGGYTPGVPGTAHTSSKIDPDVTFSRQCDQRKMRKRIERFIANFFYGRLIDLSQVSKLPISICLIG